MSLVAVLVPTFALFVAVALLSARVLSVAVRLWPSVGRPIFARSSALRAAILAAPPLIAALICIAVLSVATLAGCHCVEHDLHHPHLCLVHPLFALPLLGVATWFIGLWAVFTAPRTIALGRALIASIRWMSTVRRVEPRWVDGIAVRIVDCSARGAFTVGALSPLIVFDRSLWTALTKEQRRAVVHHEQAHATRRDGLTLLTLRVCAALFPHAMAGRLIKSWSAATELSCDRHAAARVGDEATVAEALVAVERARSHMPSTRTDSFVTAMAVAAPGSVEQRVMNLLDNVPQSASRSVLANDVFAVTLVVIAAAVATCLWPGDSIHHGVETIIGLLAPLL